MAPGPEERIKECMQCAELISFDEIYCSHCGELSSWVEEAEIPPELDLNRRGTWQDSLPETIGFVVVAFGFATLCGAAVAISLGA